MKTTLLLAALALLLAIPSSSFGMMSIDTVTPEKARELGIEVEIPKDSGTLRVTISFDAKGKLKDYWRTDLEIHQDGKLLLSSTLKEDENKGGRVVVSFAADRTALDRMTVRIVVKAPTPVGYDIKPSDFETRQSVR